MNQLILDLKTGQTSLQQVPAPTVHDGYVLIQTTCSLVSLGTERMLVDFGKAGWMEKAKQQPERVKEVIDKVKTDGLKPTLDAVFSKLNQPVPLGYSQAGVVIGVGKNVTGFKVGDRVASNGHHAEVVSVAKNLVARIPDDVTDESAACTVTGAIAMQSIRLLQPTFGETIAVIGLGLIGQITAQLLKANGCKVLGIDITNDKLEIASGQGIQTFNAANADEVSWVMTQSQNNGVDGVIITASSTEDQIIANAAKMCRKRGRIVLTGVIGLQLNRADFYGKELSFQVSCSYGPGRYEPDYELHGMDYPIGYVRWTEQRNMDAVLQAMSKGQLNVLPLITQRLPVADFSKVYDHMNGGHIGSLFTYANASISNTISFPHTSFKATNGAIGIIGSGNFTKAILLPSLQKANASIKGIASHGGLSAAALAKEFNLSTATTNYQTLLDDNAISTIVITTRHNQHADLACKAFAAGKHVFVEKPLALSKAELQLVIQACIASGKSLNIGFNRRFAPLAVKMKKLLGNNSAPINIVVTVNAGAVPANHWTQDPLIGGGRIIGEACHFIDLCSFLTAENVAEICMNSMGESNDNASILLRYKNGSNAVINYFSNGSKSYDKERVEVYSSGRTLILENWRKLTGYGFKGFSSTSLKQDKGHQQQFKLLVEGLKNGGAPIISFDSIVNTSLATLCALESQANNCWTHVG